MPYSNTFLPGPPDPTDYPRLSLRKIDGFWHVLAVERRHCQHVHGDGFLDRRPALRLLERVRRKLEARKPLDLVRYWESRALIDLESEVGEEWSEKEEEAA